MPKPPVPPLTSLPTPHTRNRWRRPLSEHTSLHFPWLPSSLTVTRTRSLSRIRIGRRLVDTQHRGFTSFPGEDAFLAALHFQCAARCNAQAQRASTIDSDAGPATLPCAAGAACAVYVGCRADASPANGNAPFLGRFRFRLSTCSWGAAWSFGGFSRPAPFRRPSPAKLPSSCSTSQLQPREQARPFLAMA